MEFRLEKHPNNISFSSTFNLTKKIRRDSGTYFINFDPGIPSDVAEFNRLFMQGIIDITAYSPKALAKIDPSFKDPDTKRIIENLQVVQRMLPDLYEKEDSLLAELEVLKAAVDENTDLQKVDALIDSMHTKQKEAETASIRSKTAERNLSALQSELQEQIAKKRKREADKVHQQLRQAAEEFNERMESTYRQFWNEADKLFPQLSELTQFPRGVYFTTPKFNNADAMAMKGLKSHPAIHVFPDKLSFHLKPVNKS